MPMTSPFKISPRTTWTFLATLVAALLVLPPLAPWAGLAGRATPAYADDARTVLYLVDGSGSMWARFDTPAEQRAKIDVVRELLKPLVSGDTVNRIGFGSYGHRRRGDCSDVEIIAAPGSDRAAVLGPLEKLNPKGKGPLVEALRQGAAAIGQSRPASIVVVNDGMDNCRQNACLAAAEIAKTSPGLAVHVVAIGVDPGDHPALQCIAKETGGKFFDARDPVALAAAIAEAAQLAAGAPALAGGTTGTKPAALKLPKAALTATLALASGGEPLTLKARWRIANAGGDTVKALEAPAIAEDVAPGDYTIEAEIDGLKASGTVHVEDGKPATLALALGAARLTLKANRNKNTAGTEGADNASANAPIVTISEESNGTAAGRTVLLRRLDSFDAVLPPKSYRIVVAEGQLRQERQVTLAPGTETTAEFKLSAGTLNLSAVTNEGGKPLTDVTFAIQEDDPDSPDGRRDVMRSHAGEPSFTLPAGTYYIVARSGFAETRERIALSAGDTVTKAVVMPAAPLKLTASVAGGALPEHSGLVYRIVSLDGGEREVARVRAASFSGLLNAGRYRIVATLDSHGAGASQDIVLEAGKPLAAVLKIEAGDISFKHPAGAAAHVPGETFWEVREKSGRAVWHATAAEPRVLLAPGRYSVRLEARDKSIEAAFDVVAGERKMIELGSN